MLGNQTVQPDARQLVCDALFAETQGNLSQAVILWRRISKIQPTLAGYCEARAERALGRLVTGIHIDLLIEDLEKHGV